MYKDGLIYFVMILLFIAMSVGAWKATRYLNWKFSYESYVDKRVEQLEKRIYALEQKNEN